MCAYPAAGRHRRAAADSWPAAASAEDRGPGADTGRSCWSLRRTAPAAGPGHRSPAHSPGELARPAGRIAAWAGRSSSQAGLAGDKALTADRLRSCSRVHSPASAVAPGHRARDHSRGRAVNIAQTDRRSAAVDHNTAPARCRPTCWPRSGSGPPPADPAGRHRERHRPRAAHRRVCHSHIDRRRSAPWLLLPTRRTGRG